MVYLGGARPDRGRRRRAARGAVERAAEGFGGSFNPHFHFYILSLDGVFSERPDGGVRFHEATLLTSESWDVLERTTQRRVLRAFRKRGILEEDAARDMLGWQASGGLVAIGREEASSEQGRIDGPDALASLSWTVRR